MKKPEPGNIAKSVFRRWRTKPVLIRLAFIIIALLSFAGLADEAFRRGMEPVWEHNEAFMETSLKNATGLTAVLMVPKGFLSTMETLKFSPEGFTLRAGDIQIGKLFEPLNDIVDDMFDFMTFSILIIVLQIAMLKFIKLVSLKFLLGLGSLLCAVRYHRGSIYGKLGFSAIILALLFYLVYPLTLHIAAASFEAHQMETSIQLSENLGILKEQFRDQKEIFMNISLKDFIGNILETSRNSLDILSQTGRTAWNYSWNLLMGYVFMFILTPLFTLGVIYFIMRQSIVYLDMPGMSGSMDTGAKHLISRAGRRSRRRFRPGP